MHLYLLYCIVYLFVCFGIISVTYFFACRLSGLSPIVFWNKLQH